MRPLTSTTVTLPSDGIDTIYGLMVWAVAPLNVTLVTLAGTASYCTFSDNVTLWAIGGVVLAVAVTASE